MAARRGRRSGYCLLTRGAEMADTVGEAVGAAEDGDGEDPGKSSLRRARARAARALGAFSRDSNRH